MKLWAVMRDGELYEAHIHKYRAIEAVRTYRPGSKHKWSVCLILLEPTSWERVCA